MDALVLLSVLQIPRMLLRRKEGACLEVVDEASWKVLKNNAIPILGVNSMPVLLTADFEMYAYRPWISMQDIRCVMPEDANTF